MLFKQVHLEKIKTGKVSLAYRRWKTKRVKKGSLIKTSIGLVQITAIDLISEEDITDEDVQNAGYSQRDELLKLLSSGKGGDLFKIQMRFYSEDPRIDLRRKSDLSTEDIVEVTKKLKRMDRFSKRGEWVTKILKAISENSELRAADLATILQVEKDWLKTNVRKLKNLGLTISHGVGYSISPWGEVILTHLIKTKT